MQPLEVIVLDGDQRSALAVTRSLGRREIRVHVGSVSGRGALSARSRYCAASFTYPSPYTNSGGFVRAVADYAARCDRPVVFPMTDVTCGEILKNRQVFASSVSFLPGDYERFAAASDKIHVYRLASALDVPVPAMVFSDGSRSRTEFLEALTEFPFPLVLKPYRSRIQHDGKWMDTHVRYVSGRDDLDRALADEPFRSHPFLVQERIVGPGLGVFVLLERGRVVAHFAHRRLREKPPSGGVSVLSESIPAPPDTLGVAVRLLQALEWDGVAMVEFKCDRRDGVPKLMEINGRFWGSLQLAVSAGVDFPYLVYRLVRGEAVPAMSGYRVGIKSRWELGDLDHLVLRLRAGTGSFPHEPSRCAVLVAFLADWFRPSVKGEVFRADDPGPFLCELHHYLRHVLRVRGKACSAP